MKKALFAIIMLLGLSGVVFAEEGEVLRPDNVDERGNPYDEEFAATEADTVYDDWDDLPVTEPIISGGDVIGEEKEAAMDQEIYDRQVSEGYDESEELIAGNAEEEYNSGEGR